MQHAKPKKCDARKLPKWLVDYMISLQSKSHSDLNDHLNAEVSAGGTCKSTTANDSPDIATGKRVRELGNSLMGH